MEFAPSEDVVLHPLRFTEPTRRRVVQRAAVGRVAAMAAVVGLAAAGSIVLEPRAVRIFGRLRAGRRLRALPGGGGRSWPDGSLEAALQSAIHAAAVGVDLHDALRNLLVTGGRLVPDVVAFVERGLQARAIDPASATDPARADAVHTLLADFREREPDTWTALGREVDRALRPPLLRHALLEHGDDDRPIPPWRRRARDYLESWRRLNRDPPSARVGHGHGGAKPPTGSRS
jgi:hypothetical protein